MFSPVQSNPRYEGRNDKNYSRWKKQKYEPLLRVKAVDDYEPTGYWACHTPSPPGYWFPDRQVDRSGIWMGCDSCHVPVDVHVDRRRWRSILVWSHQLTSDLKRYIFWKCLRWSSRKAVLVPTSVIRGLRGSTTTSSLVRCMCVIVVTMRGWADVGLLVAVCFLAKISLHRPTCKTTIARLTQSQAISQSFRVLITFRSMRDTAFFHFSKLFFYTKLPFPLPWWSKDLLVENLQVAGGQLRNPPVQFRHDLGLHLAIDHPPVCPNRARRELCPRKWFLLGRNPWR